MDNAASASGAIAPVGCPDRVRVLAVDEDPIYLTTLTQMLQRCGYEVTAKASPEEAMGELLLNPEAFDLVMTVAHTRGTGIDGFDLLKHFKNRLPVILFSGDEPVETVKRGVLGGACDFLIKPVLDNEMHRLWKHVVRWRLNAANGGADPRKRGSAGVVHGSGEGGITKKINLSSQLLQASIARAAQQLRGTEDDSPRGIRYLLEAEGVEVTTEQVAIHLEKYRRDFPINHLPARPLTSSSHCNISNDYSIYESSEFYMKPQGATNINQASQLGNGASPVGCGILGDERYREIYAQHIYKNSNRHGNGDNCNGYDYHYGNGNGNANANANANGCHNGSLPSNLAQQAHQVMPQGFGNGPGGLVANGNMVSASLPPNLAQPVHQVMPNTGLFPSNLMCAMDNPNPTRQHAFPQTSRLRYNGRTGGIWLSPWDVDDDHDLLRSYLGENEVIQNTATTGIAQGTHGDGVAGQTSASQPQDLTGNSTAGTSGGTGVVTDEVMECALNEDESFLDNDEGIH